MTFVAGHLNSTFKNPLTDLVMHGCCTRNFKTAPLKSSMKNFIAITCSISRKLAIHGSQNRQSQGVREVSLLSHLLQPRSGIRPGEVREDQSSHDRTDTRWTPSRSSSGARPRPSCILCERCYRSRTWNHQIYSVIVTEPEIHNEIETVNDKAIVNKNCNEIKP